MEKGTLKATNGKSRKKLSALCSITGLILVIAVIVAMLPVFIPRVMGYEVYDVVTGSMEPEIPTGSMVLVDDAEPSRIAEGDIIAYDAGKMVITHRVVRNDRDEGFFITKGDANNMEDMSPVAYSQLIGKVTKHIPVAGRVMSALTGVKGKIFLIALLAAGILLQAAGRRSRNG